MVVDCVTFNGEYDLLEMRFNILLPFVDQFIVCEAATTFSGKPKPLYFLKEIERFKQWKSKIKYCIINEDYTKEEIALAESSPNTTGAAHWKHEFLQKESIKKALTHLKDDDICFIGDVDEIWEPKTTLKWYHTPFKYKLRVYTYYLNNKSSEEFWGTLVSYYKNIRNSCLNHLRTNAEKTMFYAGWHFTSMGGYREVTRKLGDSYTEETYWNPTVQSNLKENMDNNRDFLGRNFTYRLDESNWPEYLKENRDKYKHLMI